MGSSLGDALQVRDARANVDDDGADGKNKLSSSNEKCEEDFTSVTVNGSLVLPSESNSAENEIDPEDDLV